MRPSPNCGDQCSFSVFLAFVLFPAASLPATVTVSFSDLAARRCFLAFFENGTRTFLVPAFVSLKLFLPTLTGFFALMCRFLAVFLATSSVTTSVQGSEQRSLRPTPFAIALARLWFFR